ncbi:MAG: FAD-dependent oxidoreductase [Patescibacteria group bacterium]
MEKYKYLIAGGGVAGATAAETIRGRDSEGSIAIVNEEPYMLYSRVMLSKPNFFLGQIPFESIWLKGKEWYEKNRVVFMGAKKLEKLETGRKLATLSDGTQIEYDKLLLATGVCTREWQVAGADKKGVFYLRTLEDGKKIIEAVKTGKRAIVIGGGFIGFEMADMLHLAGLDVTMVIRENYFWEPLLNEASGRMIEKAMTENGVKILYNLLVNEVLGNEEVKGVLLSNGTRLDCDMIICGIGAECHTDWIKSIGLNVNRGILANEYLETNLPDIWTAGDTAEFKDLILDETVQIGNWVNAREQGRIAAINMTGERKPFKFVSFYTTQGMGVTIAFVGDVRMGPDRIVIQRGSPEINSYGRIIILDKGSRKEVEGATFINRTKEMGSVAKLIESNMDVSNKTKELGDPNFDLKLLLPAI